MHDMFVGIGISVISFLVITWVNNVRKNRKDKRKGEDTLLEYTTLFNQFKKDIDERFDEMKNSLTLSYTDVRRTTNGLGASLDTLKKEYQEFVQQTTARMSSIVSALKAKDVVDIDLTNI